MIKLQEQPSLTCLKRFDTISHSVLLKKLFRYGIQDNELNWFTDYLFLRKQIVQFKGVLSEPNPVFTGVSQGSILGPLLFLIHFNDVHKALRYSKIRDLTQNTTATATRTSPNKRFNEENNGCARAL